MTGSAAAALGSFIADTRYADLPEDVVAKAKRHILDTFGAALAGAAGFEPRQVLGVLAPSGDTGSAPVWGTGTRLSARDAALANGVAAHALELDDTGGCDHSGAVVLPASLAALSVVDRPVSGRELLTAVVLGYDIGRRVLEACGGYSAHNGAGWHSTATCGVFGAAAAAASIMGLDERHVAASLGHAGSFSGGLWAFIHDASQTKRLHAGRAAEGGLLAALLARQGITGPTEIFADVWGGFLKTLAPETRQPEALTAELGSHWKIRRCSIKPYASCRGTHSTIDAITHLMRGREGRWNDVRSVRVRLSPFLMDMCGGRDLGTLAAAQMSLPYAIAATLVFGSAGIDSYLAPRRADPRIGTMLDRILLEVDGTMPAADEPEVAFAFGGDAPVLRRVLVPLGAPTNPLSDGDLVAKYTALAGSVLPTERADALAAAVLDLDRLSDVRTLLGLLPGDAQHRELLR